MHARAPSLRPASNLPPRRLPIVAYIPLWILISPLALVAIMRLVAWDDLEPFAVLNTLTAFVYLPAWIVLAVAALGRRFALALAALVIVAAQIAFLLPELTSAQPVPAWAHHAPAITLLDANVYDRNPSMAGYAKQISLVHPQLVTMEEANPLDTTQLIRAGVLNALPYRFEVSRYDPAAFFIASSYQLDDTHVAELNGRPFVVQTTLELPSGPQPLWVVHTTAPLPSSFSQWEGQLAAIGSMLRTRGTTGLLVIGDFNATWGNKDFRDILGAGMTDGAAARGRFFDMTWSQTAPVIPPIVRIDHVLTGPGVAVTGIRTEPGPGSDHRDLIATVAVQRSSSPRAPVGHRARSQ